MLQPTAFASRSGPCDLSIHKSNKFTEKHCRFLFTGLRVGLEELASEAMPAVGTKRKANGKGAAKESRMNHAPDMMMGGYPGMVNGYPQDVDAAYMADEFGQYAPVGVPDDVSHVLEVPDLDFGNFGMQSAAPNAQQSGNWMDDGVVPEITY
eukprot:scaffold316276_cov37-Prasinocladus_malaysianus.AAC.1